MIHIQVPRKRTPRPLCGVASWSLADVFVRIPHVPENSLMLCGECRAKLRSDRQTGWNADGSRRVRT